EPGRRVSVEREVFPALVAQGRLAGFPTDDYWTDAGRPELYRRANIDLVTGVRGPPEPALAEGALVDPTSIVQESVVGSGATVAAGATVRRSVLLPDAVVAADALVERSIVAGRVGVGARIVDCVVAAGHGVAAGAHAEHQLFPDLD